MAHALVGFALAAALFVGMLLCFEIGRRTVHKKQSPNDVGTKTGPVEAEVFALLGLLVAFTFYGAADRLDHRRDLIIEEANDIGTAYKRVDLLPADVQPEVREAFRNYVDSRLEYYKRLTDSDEAAEQLARGSELQKIIWDRSVAGSEAPNTHRDAGKLLLPALNSMIDIANTRRMNLQKHPPNIIFAMLFGIALVCSLLAGHSKGGSKVKVFPMLAFAAVMAVAVYVILDLEFPRFGLIRVDAFDQALVDVRAEMK
jgi:hypothetical protein